MTQRTKAILSLIGIAVAGSVGGALFGFDGHSVTYGYMVGCLAEIVYFNIIRA